MEREGGVKQEIKKYGIRNNVSTPRNKGITRDIREGDETGGKRQ